MQLHLITFDEPLTKRCTKCGESKPATAEFFSRYGRNREGLAAECKVCEAARKRARRPLVRQRESIYRRAYRAANKERIAEKDREYKLKNQQKIVAQNKVYRATHPEVQRAASLRRRARELSASGTHTAADIEAQYQRQNGRCYYCRAKVGKHYHIDHIVPLSRGGTNDPDNLVVSCERCNKSKGDRFPHEWPQGGRLL